MARERITWNAVNKRLEELEEKYKYCVSLKHEETQNGDISLTLSYDYKVCELGIYSEPKQLSKALENMEIILSLLDYDKKEAEYRERKKRQENFLIGYQDKCVKNRFGVVDRANKDFIYIVFDKRGKFVTTKTVGCKGLQFNDIKTFEDWLKKSKKYAQALSSFYVEDLSWYEKDFKEQLKDLGWHFDSNGCLIGTLW